MNDSVWAGVRYLLIAAGTFGAAKGWFPAESVGPTVDALQQPISGMVASAAAMWGLWIAFRTKRVPLETAERKDVPTISPITGQQIPGRVKDHY